jgi:hypothetical protein
MLVVVPVVGASGVEDGTSPQAGVSDSDNTGGSARREGYQ